MARRDATEAPVLPARAAADARCLVERRLWVLLACAVHGVAGCGGETATDPSGLGTGGRAGSAAGVGGAPSSGGGGVFEAGAGHGEIIADYQDPGCPDAGGPEIREECEPFAPQGGCATGEACVPFVDYPLSPCGREVYGTRCEPAGSGSQGDRCTESACSAGHACVVTGEGTQCVRLCHVAADDCPPGMFCEPIDVQPGIGGCY